ncbi:MAG TPA: thiopurine S-methyltransferase [Gammaproteobacteria bacterium]|nr:thiopurine S-methyltransferase [Gammaproteobacteria bacterium]
MNPEFWHERWAANQIGFHQQEINDHLQKHWHGLDLPAGSRILVPLCGKSLDMLWLREQGHAVVGIEISPLAVAAFFRENALTPDIREEAGYSCWSFDRLEIYCGDFFQLHATELGTLDGCYDRAALVALPETLRPRYAAHLAGLLPPASRGLLVTMEYPQPEMHGPPFAVPRQEVSRLFSGQFDIDHLDQFDALAANPSFRERGLSGLTEHVWSLRRR